MPSQPDEKIPLSVMQPRVERVNQEDVHSVFFSAISVSEHSRSDQSGG